ncbi:MAG: putative glycosyltransferase EpsJ [Syntrophorhabdus sp. PtaU1.Bin002]|nr:MAG: putative glycosyltransferase EpsJ [Syntrophorhabdus sp. PtaU1.Bin002]
MIDQTADPLVSIIIPTYNYGKYLERAVRSCLDQTHKHLEIIVIDDGSTDNTREVAQGFSDKIIYIHQQNMGVSSARNHGLERARGEFITFLDADDYLTEDSIKTSLSILLKYPDIGTVFSQTYSEDADGSHRTFKSALREDCVSDKFYEDLLMGHLPFQTCGVMMRRSLARQFRFPVDLSNGEDVAYFTKVLFAAKAYFCAKPMVINRRHPDSLRHNVDLIKKQGIEPVPTILNDPYYHGALDHLRQDLTANRYLELFRRFYLSGEKSMAKQYYLKGIHTKPSRIFKIDYLIKFIKAWF